MSVELLTQLYVGYFNRAPDPEGFAYWEARYAEGMTPAEIAQSFSVQTESTTNYPYLDDQGANSAGDFINQIYLNLFNRLPDPEGLTYWTAQLDAGRPVGGFILDVINGARNTEDGQDKTMLANKVSVGDAFKEANTGSTASDIIDQAKDVMSGVNQSEASVQMALGKIADKASGATTVFTGEHLGSIEDGTLLLTKDIYSNSFADDTPDSILVTNGAALVSDGIFSLGGTTTTTIRGGASLQMKSAIEGERAEFGRFTGDNATLNVADGAEVTFEKDLRLGKLRIDDDRGVVGGTSEAELNILSGGKVHVKNQLEIANEYEPRGGDDTGTSKSNILIQGENSKLTVDDNLHGASSGGEVLVDIRSGGKLEVANQLELGHVTEYDIDRGGKASLEVRGSNSSVTAGEIRGGIGESASLSIFADDGASITTSNFTELGKEGGHAQIKLTDGATFQTNDLTIGRLSGSTADIEISRGASLVSENWLNIGEFQNGETYDDGSTATGTTDGETKVSISVTEGGKLIANGGMSAAHRWELDTNFEAGNESANVEIVIDGEGSLLTTGKSADFAMSKNANASLTIQNGGDAIFTNGAFFGMNSSEHDLNGGSGTLIVSGEGSSVSFSTKSDNSMSFGDGENTHGRLEVNDSAIVSIGGLDVGRNGGYGEVLVDGGELKIAYEGDNAENSTIAIFGQDASETASTLTIKNGGTVTIDGLGEQSPKLELGEKSGAKADVEVSGSDSKLLLQNDFPRSETNPDFGNGYILIGRDGEVSFSILEGGQVVNTPHGVVSIGENETSKATLIVDGEGSLLNFGGAMFIGNYTGTSDTNVRIENGAEIKHGESFTLSNGTVLTGAYLQGGGANLTIDGSAKINTNLSVLNGTFVVSDAVETVSINGSYEHTGGEVNLQIAGTANHDKLAVSQTATLKGELNISFENGYAGAAGDSFDLFTATSFDIGEGFVLDVTGLATGLDAQLQVSGGVASLVVFDSEVADFAIV
jgi:T5SS/PEP-CTERM-associated repeat protein